MKRQLLYENVLSLHLRRYNLEAENMVLRETARKIDAALPRCYNIDRNNLGRWSRGVAWSNTLPCQGRDRGFESRRLRTILEPC